MAGLTDRGARNVALRAAVRREPRGFCLGPEGGPPSPPGAAQGLLNRAIRADNPVMLLECEARDANKCDVPEQAEDGIPRGQAAARRAGPGVTGTGSRGMLSRVLEAAEELVK